MKALSRVEKEIDTITIRIEDLARELRGAGPIPRGVVDDWRFRLKVVNTLIDLVEVGTSGSV